MKLRVSCWLVTTLALCAGCAASRPGPPKEEDTVAEAFIRQRLQDWAKALSAKDIRGATWLYAPDIVSFDIKSAPAIRGGGDEASSLAQGLRCVPRGVSVPRAQ